MVYGLGDILGAGIYALIGKVAAEASVYSWAAFLVAFLVAILTGLSYAELVQKFPKSSGASYYVGQAFKSPKMPLMVGWFVTAASIVSLSAASRAFAGYFQEISEFPESLFILIFISSLTLINFRGIAQSSTTNIICTAIELSGLLCIIFFGLWHLDLDMIDHAATGTGVAASSEMPALGILVGASLAFYAFMGFEDLANVAEEAKNPQRDIPISMIVSLIGAGIIYVTVSWLATQYVVPQELKGSSAPLVLLADKIGVPLPNLAFTVISLFAVANTALLNAITGSRLIYGLSDQGLLPKILSKTHKRTKTPYIAILVVFAFAVALGLFGSLEVLAGATSLLLLLTFCTVHIALIKLRKKEKARGFRVPIALPWLGIAAALSLIALLPAKQQILGGALVLVGFILVSIYTRAKKI